VAGRFGPVLERGLADVLREDGRLSLLECGLDCAALERVVASRAPRVAILGEATEDSMLARLRSIQPSTGILVFAHDPSSVAAMRLLAAEATCIPWCVSAADLLASVHFVAQGGRMFMLADGHRVERQYPADMPTLTSREVDVLEHLSRDRTNAEIAVALGIGVETVRTYVARILRKLSVQGRQELVGMPLPARLERAA
jgi:DNA-binding NarL/FixJ family response regulator